MDETAAAMGVGADPHAPGSGAVPDAPGSGAFGMDAFTLDDRLRLFHFAAADKRHDYLWLLRAFDRGRANYQVLLHASQARELLAALRAGHPACPEIDDVQPLLDSLADWRLLDRSYDGTRAANLAEYRNRHYVYQFTQAGYRAYRAVEEVLGAGLEDAQLSRLVFPDILADLKALAEANRAGDGEEVHRKLARLDQALSDMAMRAARFYLMLGDLARTNDTRPEVFLTHKDALLSHMREFTAELARYQPLLAAAVDEAAGTGAERLIALAAGADERLFRSAQEREQDWRQRWAGLTHWFGSGTASEAERLQSATVTAIAGVLAMLRRVTEARRGGVSRESQLRHLAQWFASCPGDDDAHALFQATFDLGSPRHIAVPHEDPELISSRLSWWEAEPVRVARTLVQAGRAPRLHGVGRIERNEAQRQRLRAEQLKAQRQRQAAAASLASDGVYDRVLDEPETQALLGLLDLALSARVAVSRTVAGPAMSGAAAGPAMSGAAAGPAMSGAAAGPAMSGAAAGPAMSGAAAGPAMSGAAAGPAMSPVASGSAHGVRLTLRPCEGSTTVTTVRGRLHLDGLRLEIS